jgi:hypothetical protein
MRLDLAQTRRDMRNNELKENMDRKRQDLQKYTNHRMVEEQEKY